MDVRVTETAFSGVRLVEPACFEDDRGFFFESYHSKRLAENGISQTFVQDNHSRSWRHVLRGFHYQDGSAPQYRLIRCTVGEIWDVVVDLRVGSPSFGRWFGITLSALSRTQLFIAPEFAHGFVVLSDVAEVQYKCSGHHTPSAERTLAWDDCDLAVSWPVKQPHVSARDRRGMSLKEYLEKPDFVYASPLLV